MTTATIPQEVLDELPEIRAAQLDPNMPPCPDWCTLDAGHPWDSTHGDVRVSRGHQGPYFGEYVCVGSLEFMDGVGVQHFDLSIHEGIDGNIDRPEQARGFAVDVIAAAEWIEART